jgi:hypothetical protein
VRADDPGTEVPLTDPAYFAPMPVYYQRLNFSKIAVRPKTRDAVLRDYLAAYERRREAGLHQGPPLNGMRLYEHSWTMDRHASNAKTPDRRTLVYAYPAEPSGATTGPVTTGDAR